MATREEPSRRYKSAAAFADDIERFLTGNPVADCLGKIRQRQGE